MIRWIVFYDDGSSFSNLDGEPDQAPRWGIICISGYDQNGGRSIQHRTDYYCWNYEQWIAMDGTGLIDYLANFPGKEKVVLMGRHVPNYVFDRVYHMADTDPRLPPRSSRHPLEDWRQQL